MAKSDNTTEPTIADILRKVQRVQIVADRAVNDLFAGQYKSVFRGRGMEFDEVREYQPGDDIRTIDWNVTARTGNCFIKRFSEERELTVLFVVDISASGIFGSTNQSKLELVVELAGLLMFSALKNNDKVGLITFCDDVVDFLPPRKGKSHVLHALRKLVAAKPIARETCVAKALEYLNRVQRRRSVVFLVSDFLGDQDQRQLAIANRRHDLTAINVSDPREKELPNVGILRLRDAESGQIVEVDTSSPQVRAIFKQRSQQRSDSFRDTLRRAGVDELPIQTGDDYGASLRRFFKMREQRIR